VEEMRSIAIVSGKGGVGKTTVTVNLSASLMDFKKNVIAIDADVRMCGLGLQLGMYYFPVTLNDILGNKAKLLEGLYIHSSGLRIIPASLCVRPAAVSRLRRVLDDPILENNMILVDSPPGLENNVISVLKACREALIVTTPEIPAIADVMKTIVAARKAEVNILGIVLNKYRKGESDQVSMKEIESTCGLPVIGLIPEDKNIRRSIFRRIPAVFLYPYAPSSIVFREIAARLIGERYNPPGRFKRILKRMKR
jgi:septum site-determining protein MinD